MEERVRKQVQVVRMVCCDFCPYVDKCEPEKNIPPTTPLLPCWWEYGTYDDWKKGSEAYKKVQEEIFKERLKRQKEYWDMVLSCSCEEHRTRFK